MFASPHHQVTRDRIRLAYPILGFLVYSALCYRVIYSDGAEVLEGWRSFFLFDWFAATLTAAELRFYARLSWIGALIVLIFRLATHRRQSARQDRTNCGLSPNTPTQAG